MTLLDRIRANRCAVEDCQRERNPHARFCTADITEDWMNRLDYLPDGRIVRRRALRARDESGYLRAA